MLLNVKLDGLVKTMKKRKEKEKEKRNSYGI